MPFHDSASLRGRRSRRFVLAALPIGAASIVATPGAFAQPAASDPVSFYLGQVLALATLQAQAVRRLRPLLAAPALEASVWLNGASAEAGVIGAVAAVLSAMEPPPELSASVAELRLASAAYQGAATATQMAAGGDPAAATTASAGLTEGATHILLWLDALTVETGNDWGDGLRTLTAGDVQAAASEAASAPLAAQKVIDVPVSEPTVEVTSTEQDAGSRRSKRRAKRQNES